MIEIISVSLRDKNSLFDRDFIFKLKMKKMYIYYENANFDFINVRNNFI